MSIRSSVRLVVHAVWSVQHRTAVLTQTHDAWLCDALARKAESLGSAVLAAGVATDHVHVVLELPPTQSLANVVGQMKGYAAFMWNRASPPRDNLTWQDGYWARSCEPEDLARLLDYVTNQRRRHGEAVSPGWEPNP